MSYTATLLQIFFESLASHKSTLESFIITISITAI